MHKPYYQYWSNRREEGEERRKEILRGLEKQGAEIVINPTSGCSTLHFFPKGKKQITHHSYYGPTAINKFLTGLMEKLSQTNS